MNKIIIKIIVFIINLLFKLLKGYTASAYIHEVPVNLNKKGKTIGAENGTYKTFHFKHGITAFSD
jgi:hypothetical protein